jgi:hypothetical protein
MLWVRKNKYLKFEFWSELKLFICYIVMTSKPVSFSELKAVLNEQLKPLIEIINRLKEEQSGTNTQLSCISQMLTNVCSKLDAHDQTIHFAITDAVKKAAPKKLAGKGKNVSAKKTTKKPQVRKGVKKNNEDEDEVTEDAADEIADEVADEAEEADEVADETEEKKTKKPIVRKSVQKKTAAKLPTKKAVVKKPVKTKTNPNIMSIFNTAFREDESQFDKCLTPKVKKEIESNNKDEWKDLEGEALFKARSKTYYNYIRANHSQVLKDLKEAFTKERVEDDAEEDADVNAEEDE